MLKQLIFIKKKKKNQKVLRKLEIEYLDMDSIGYLTKNFLTSQILWLLWNILLQFMIFFSLLKVNHQAPKSTNFFQSLNNHIKSLSLSTAKFKGFSHKVNFSHSEWHFFLPFLMITLLLHLLLVVLTVPTLIIRIMINLTALTMIIVIDYCIMKNINYSLYVLAGIRIVRIMKKKRTVLNTSTCASSHYFFVFKKREMILIYLATLHARLNFHIINIFAKEQILIFQALKGCFYFTINLFRLLLKIMTLNYIIYTFKNIILIIKKELHKLDMKW